MKSTLRAILVAGIVCLNFAVEVASEPRDDRAGGEAVILTAQSASKPVKASNAGVIIPGLGRGYLAYPRISGTISFNNCWRMGREELIAKWIDEFNSFYPDIKVVNDNLKSCTELLQYQKTLIEGGVPPDVLMIQSQQFRMFTAINALRPLDDWIERDGIDPDWFYASEWNSRRIDGRTYGLPNVTAGAQLLIFYKQKYLRKAGMKPVETWQDLEALAKVARAENIFIMDPGKIPASSKNTFFQALLYSNGGRLWNDEFTEITWNSPEGLEAAEWLLKFVKLQADNYEALRARGEHRDIVVAEVFATGPYIAALNGSWFFYQLKKAAPDLSYVAAPFPRNALNPKSMGHVPVEGGWSFCVAENISPQNQAAAWEWIKFTTLSQYACEFTVAQMRPSPVRRCNEDKRLPEKNPNWDAVKTSLERSEAVPIYAIHLQLQDILVHMQDAILFELMPPAKAMNIYAEKAQALMDEWNREQRNDKHGLPDK